jgi:thiamine-phosphate pyrophosphorylase
MKREALAVYPVLDLEHAGGHPELMVAAALRGGATIVQLRDKRDSASTLVRAAKATRLVLEQAGVPLIINDRLDLALSLGAEGVHVGQRDMPVATVRELARAAGRPGLIIGVSVTTAAQAGAALAAGADYVSISPIFATTTKLDIEPPAGLEGLRAVRAAHPTAPIVAIGGIKPVRAAEVISAGADGVAFVSALGDAGAAEAAVRAFAAAVAHSRPVARSLS